MQKCGVYSLTNTVDNKRYVGQSVDMLSRRGCHFSSLKNNSHTNRYLQNAVNKHGVDCFEFQILEELNEELLDSREQAWIARYAANNPKFGYNQESGGNRYKKHSLETRLKMSEAGKRKPPLSAETRKRISESKLNCPAAIAQVANLGRASKGRIRSEETRRRLSVANSGKIPSDETRLKLSQALMGRVVTAETRKKIGEANRDPSEETLKRMSIAAVQRETVKRSNKPLLLTVST